MLFHLLLDAEHISATLTFVRHIASKCLQPLDKEECLVMSLCVNNEKYETKCYAIANPYAFILILHLSKHNFYLYFVFRTEKG